MALADVPDLLTTPRAGAYGVVLADPPSRFRNRGKQRENTRGAERHYPTMTWEAIEALPVREVAAKDAWLFFWTSGPYLEKHLAIARKWGFSYSTRLTWVKLRRKFAEQPALFWLPSDFPIGMGFVARAQTEMLLICRRGSPKLLGPVPEIVFAPRREHSRKPDQFYEVIERLAGDVPKLEMFSRATAKGWDAWGLETGKFDV